MRLTAFSDYTLRVLMFLALKGDRRATIPEIAEAYAVSENHLMKVVHQLAKQGVIESARGKGGGIRLAHPAAEVRLGAVVRASEGDGPIVECLSGNPGGCRIAPACRLAGVLGQAFEVFYAALDATTLADLVQQPQELQAILLPSLTLPETP